MSTNELVDKHEQDTNTDDNETKCNLNQANNSDLGKVNVYDVQRMGKRTSSPHSSTSSASNRQTDPPLYHIKWIKWKGSKCPIITQNENGPCPLIAIINVLLLKGRIRLPGSLEVIAANQLIEYLGDCILSSMPKNLSEDVKLNYEQNMHDSIAILPKLQTGLDVNVKFTGISDFEYTPELIVFDLLHIPIYHGWLIDPQLFDIVKSVGSCSYNQLVDKVITNKTSPNPDLVAEALIVEQFLEKTASQLTHFGLLQLITNINEHELSVFFRNNHFITLYKNKNELFQLVTDQGFLNESNVVWETLMNIQNDGVFVDSDLNPVPPKPSQSVNNQQQVDQDYLIALTLQEEAKKQSDSEKEWESFKVQSGMEGLTDEELARRLQKEEEMMFQKLQQQQQQQQQQKQPQQNQNVKQESKKFNQAHQRVQPQPNTQQVQQQQQQQQQQQHHSGPRRSPSDSSKDDRQEDDGGNNRKPKASCLIM